MNIGILLALTGLGGRSRGPSRTGGCGRRRTAGGLVWVGMAAALPGIWLVSRDSRPGRRDDVRGALLDGAVAGVGFGVLFIALAQISSDAGPLPLAAVQAIGAVLTIAAAAGLRQVWRPSPGVLGWGGASLG